jgi:3-hydroxybutyryl-CoA dehydrogenase
MAIYELNPDALNVLLTGEADVVVEFAHVLTSRNIPFSILPLMDEIDELDMEFPDMDLDGEALALNADMFGAFSSRVIEDLRAQPGAFTHIIDLSFVNPFDRKITLEIAASVNPRATVLASTLTGTATELGLMSNTPSRIVGIGVVPSLMSTTTLMEYAPGLNTSAEHTARAHTFLQTLGYTPERVEDRVALVHMRVLATLINEAAFAVMEGVATPADIDQAMKLGTNYPKGLLEWADEIGIPIVTLVLESLYREYQQERYRPCVLLKQYMRAGWNGKAAGRGFYTY